MKNNKLNKKRLAISLGIVFLNLGLGNKVIANDLIPPVGDRDSKLYENALPKIGKKRNDG